MCSKTVRAAWEAKLKSTFVLFSRMLYGSKNVLFEVVLSLIETVSGFKNSVNKDFKFQNCHYTVEMLKNEYIK